MKWMLEAVKVENEEDEINKKTNNNPVSKHPT